MMCRRFVALVVLLLTALPAPAGILFWRNKKNPADQVSKLVDIIRTEKSDSKRESAIEDLRKYDLNGYPEVVNVLIERLQNDSSSDVRKEAIETLLRMQPIPQQAVSVLQQIEAQDSSSRVRREAKKALAHAPSNGNALPPKASTVNVFRSPEPPLASAPASSKMASPLPTPTTAPDLQPVPLQHQPVQGTTVARPLPEGPVMPEHPAPSAPPPIATPANADPNSPF